MAGSALHSIRHNPVRDQAPIEGFSCIEGDVRLTQDETWLLIAQQVGSETSVPSGG
jgi:hypothetical protein